MQVYAVDAVVMIFDEEDGRMDRERAALSSHDGGNFTEKSTANISELSVSSSPAGQQQDRLEVKVILLTKTLDLLTLWVGFISETLVT